MSNSSGPDPGLYMPKGERGIFAFVVTFTCVLCLLVNGLLLCILLSKAVFREIPRYCLLFNLLLADTIHMFFSQLLYLIANTRTSLYFPVCALITLSIDVANEVSPLTVLLMSLEQYVAVCFPLHHATLLTGRRTAVAVVLLWALSLLNLVVRVGILMQFPFHTLDTLLMNDYCSSLVIRIAPLAVEYDQGYMSFLFGISSLAIMCSYVMVMRVAHRCASEKSVKARNTLILHLFQLVLSLSATIYMPLLMSVAQVMTRLTYVRIQTILYVLIMILPRGLSGLIYGIRDQTIRSSLQKTIFCKTH